MSRRRWTQFSLRFLFVATLLAASIAWWFRSGVVKPEFQLERFSHETVKFSGKRLYFAHIRLVNAGPDSIWLNDDSVFQYKVNENQPWLEDVDGWHSLESIGQQWVSHQSPIRLRPREFNTFAVSVNERDRTIKLGVDISDRRKRRTRTYWSQDFAIPDDLFSSPTP